ncbi:MAG: GNAT family N-acetyltransferase [Anaerolineales bacterium]|jgi:GNAT superfamily N-acetyltransferase
MINIRSAVVDDANAIARVQVDTWRSAYRSIIPDSVLDSLSYEQRSEHWSSILARKDRVRVFLVAEEEEHGVIGFCVCGLNRDEASGFEAELYAIYVLEMHQGRGIGRALFRECRKWTLDRGMSSMIVWVLRDNPYRRFYEALGGKVVSEQMISIRGVELPEVAYGWRFEVGGDSAST